MKTLIPILSTLVVSTTSISPYFFQKHDIVEKNEVRIERNILSKYDLKYLFELLCNAMIVSNNKLSLNFEKIVQSEWPIELYKIVTSDYYQEWFNILYEKDEIFMVDGEIIFQNENKYAWGETFWYTWISGYWVLHLSKYECDIVSNTLLNGGDAAGVLGDALGTANLPGTILTIVGGVMSLIGVGLQGGWQTINGMKIHFWFVVPSYFERK